VYVLSFIIFSGIRLGVPGPPGPPRHFPLGYVPEVGLFAMKSYLNAPSRLKLVDSRYLKTSYLLFKIGLFKPQQIPAIIATKLASVSLYFRSHRFYTNAKHGWLTKRGR